MKQIQEQTRAFYDKVNHYHLQRIVTMNLSLKKLNKATKKINYNSALDSLKRAPLINNRAVQSELIDIAKQSGLEALSEVATPLNPILSWFEGGQTITLRSRTTTEMNPLSGESKRERVVNNQALSIARLPLKSPPCKKCPALASGLCKCALKRFK